MKRILVLLLFGLVVAAGLFLFFLGGGGESTTAEGGGASASPQSTLPASDPGQATRAPSAELPQGKVSTATRSVVPEPAEEQWDPTQSVWIEGRVLLPEGMPSDPDLEVFALAQPIRYVDFAFLTSSPARAHLAEEYKLEDPRELGLELLARRKVEPDGSFKLPFRPGLRRGHLMLRGRYLYLEESSAVGLTSGATRLVLQPKEGAYLRGQVRFPAGTTDSERRELSALLSASDGEGNKPEGVAAFMAQTFVDRSGRFDFFAVPLDSEYELRVDGPELALFKTQVQELLLRRPTPIDLQLTRGAVVRGRVVDELGRAVAGAELTTALDFGQFGNGNEESGEGESDADGGFELRGLPAGKTLLTVEADGFLDSEAKLIELVEAEEHEVTVSLESGGSIAGRLTWPDGRPAAQVRVEATLEPVYLVGSLAAMRNIRGRDGEDLTDENGRFVLRGLGEGQYVVRAIVLPNGTSLNEGELTAANWQGLDEDESLGEFVLGARAARSRQPDPNALRAVAVNVALGETELELVLQPSLSVAGRVEDDLGQPVEEFQLRAARIWNSPSGVLHSNSFKVDIEDANGAFVLGGLEAGPWSLIASAEGYATSESQSIVLPGPDAAVEWVLELRREAVVEGVVFDPRGLPVADATIAVDLGQEGRFKRLLSGLDFPQVRSDAEGQFLLGGLAGPEIALVASHAKFARSGVLRLGLRPGDTASGIELYLNEGAQVTGEVIGESDEPLAERLVRAVHLETYEQRTDTTDSAGLFELNDLDPGTWQVFVMPPSAVAREEMLTDILENPLQKLISLTGGEKRHLVLGGVAQDSITVSGLIRVGNEILPEAIVGFWSPGSGSFDDTRRTVSDSEGAYRVELAGPGKWLVTVQGIAQRGGFEIGWEAIQNIPAGPSYALDVVLPAGSIGGRVLGQDGRPVEGESVSLHVDGPVKSGLMVGGHYATVFTGGDGVYLLKGLSPGQYALVAGGSDGVGRVLRRGLVVGDGEHLSNVNFTLQPSCKVRIKVTDQRGLPVDGANLFVRDESGAPLSLLSSSVTDASGYVELNNLSQGSYTFSARKGDLASAESRPKSLSEDGTTQLELSLSSATRLVVRVLGSDNSILPAQLSVTGGGGLQHSGLISSEDYMRGITEGVNFLEHQVGPLAPGEYTVTAYYEDQSVSERISLNGAAERVLELRLNVR